MTDIKTLNDNLRKHLIGGKIVLTQGIEAKTYEEIAEIMLKIRHFNNFSLETFIQEKSTGSKLSFLAIFKYSIDEYTPATDKNKKDNTVDIVGEPSCNKLIRPLIKIIIIDTKIGTFQYAFNFFLASIFNSALLLIKIFLLFFR